MHMVYYMSFKYILYISLNPTTALLHDFFLDFFTIKLLKNYVTKKNYKTI